MRTSSRGARLRQQLPPPWFSTVASPEPPAPVPEQRRVLPSLIVPEVAESEVELIPAADEVRAKRPRGRPRKTAPAPCASFEDLVDVAPVPTLEVATAFQADVDHPIVATAPALRALQIKPASNLAPGERWKRRLGRWARQILAGDYDLAIICAWAMPSLQRFAGVCAGGRQLIP